MFLDEAIITVQGGIGGRGCVSFRKEKYVPKGGPDGGDGGKGGDILIVANENTDTLSAFASRKNFKADKGIFGMGKNKNGRDGEDLILKVSIGTVVTEIVDGNEVRLADMTRSGERLLVAKGGRGGYGNTHFKAATRQTPDFSELGEPGEEKKLKLELKLVADVGIIGYPSVGKSTLISVVSAAKPKIADYPFTTLVPNLGVVNVDDRSFIVCDVPGLIEGASEGKGLGGQFLKHIERCGILLHMLDVSRALDDPKILINEYKAIRKELSAHSPILAKKKELIILNKIDLTPDDIKKFEDVLKDEGIELFTSISAATKNGTDDLMKKLLPIVLEERGKRLEVIDDDEMPVLKPHLDTEKMGAYHMETKPDGIYVTGKRLEQFTKMTDFSKEGGVRRLRYVIDRIGLKKAIKKERGESDIPVYIGEIRVDGYL
ncbi:GTPase ObgE [Patescibacteria group bacterium]|nr:GTPase ObgE [Patescibacteria group bacterium]